MIETAFVFVALFHMTACLGFTKEFIREAANGWPEMSAGGKIIVLLTVFILVLAAFIPLFGVILWLVIRVVSHS